MNKNPLSDLYVKSLKINWDSQNEPSYYNNIKPIRNLNNLEFKDKITFFVGENGSGKSTLIEAIAKNYGFNSEGGSINFNFSTNETSSDLCDLLTLSKGLRPKDTFFLRGESFYNVASYVDEIGARNSYGGKSLHAQSHGESFASLIANRFRGNGLYILDEPESALSPQMQLSVIVMIKNLIEKGSQFIIETHSPILLGMDNSTIYTFDFDKIKEINYEETESYIITKMFLENKKNFLKHLYFDN